MKQKNDARQEKILYRSSTNNNNTSTITPSSSSPSPSCPPSTSLIPQLSLRHKVGHWKNISYQNEDQSLFKSKGVADDTNIKGEGKEEHETANICNVCHTSTSKYTCPRCHIPYCSVSCYQIHNNNEDNNNNNNLEGTMSCTENFYYNRVQSIVQLEQKSKIQDTKKIMNRTYYHYHNNNEQQQQKQDQLEDGEYEHEEEEELNEDDMIQLLELLEVLEVLEQEEIEKQDQQQPQKQQDKITKLFAKSPKLKIAFEKAIEKGEIIPLVLQPWTPWWRPTTTTINNKNDNTLYNDDDDKNASDNDDDDDDDDNDIVDGINGKTLDERLLQEVKPFHKLLGKKQVQQLPDLSYNLIEILYSIVKTLRLYHGCSNIIHHQQHHETIIDAAMTIILSSFVLSNNDTYYETLHEVLIDCTNSSTTNGTKYPLRKETTTTTTTTTASWTVLVEDLAYIVYNRRYIGRALLEALDIFNAAIAYLKKNKNKNKNDNKQSSQSSQSPQLQQQISSIDGHSSLTADDPILLLSNLRRTRKKIEYFLSWTQHSATTIQTERLSNDILEWVDHWKTTTTTTTCAITDSVVGKEETKNHDLTSMETLLLSPSLSSSTTATSSSATTTATERMSVSKSFLTLQHQTTTPMQERNGTSRKIQIIE